MTAVRVDQDLLRARNAVVITFATSGIAFASFASRTPAVREALGPDDRAAGPAPALHVGGVYRGPSAVRRSCTGSARPSACSGAPSRSGSASGSRRWASRAAPSLPRRVGLVLVGLGIGVWDVSMNVEGADVERRLDRSLMPRLHAAFSLGTVAGAGVGTVTAAAAIPIAAQVGAIAVLSPLLMIWSTRRFLARTTSAVEQGDQGFGCAAGVAGAAHAARRAPGARVRVHRGVGQRLDRGGARRRPRVERDDRRGRVRLFVAAMTVGRLAGCALLERFGRVGVLRATAACALVGLLMVSWAAPRRSRSSGAVLGRGGVVRHPVDECCGRRPARAAVRVAGYLHRLHGVPRGPAVVGLLARTTES